MKTGLVSVSFRKLSPQQIIDLVAEAGLDGIEWGGDIHVPHGEVETARQVGEATRERGLAVACYGSYCRLTDAERADGLFERVVASAAALKAPLIRVWAGGKASAGCGPQDLDEIAENARHMAELAARQGMGVAFEYHANTLTDTAQSALQLLQRANHPNLGSLWQPPVGMAPEDCLAGIETIAGYIRNIHSYCWEGSRRLPLAAGEAPWRRYLDRLAALPGRRYALLEFVEDDKPENFLRDAATLKEWAGRYS